MNEVLMPEWMKQWKQDNALAEAKGEAKTQRGKVVALKVKADGPEFWRQFLLELDSGARFLLEIGFRGRVSSFCESDKEQHCLLEVSRTGGVLGLTSTSLFYKPGGSKISSRTIEDEFSLFEFCVNEDDKLTVLADDGFTSLDAKSLADLIVREAVERLSGGEY